MCHHKGQGGKDSRGVGLHADKKLRILEKRSKIKGQINIVTYILMKIKEEQYTD